MNCGLQLLPDLGRCKKVKLDYDRALFKLLLYAAPEHRACSKGFETISCRPISFCKNTSQELAACWSGIFGPSLHQESLGVRYLQG